MRKNINMFENTNPDVYDYAMGRAAVKLLSVIGEID